MDKWYQAIELALLQRYMYKNVYTDTTNYGETRQFESDTMYA
jgi:hypothetical protein